jgi:acyl-CoA thioesterase I
VRVAAAIWVLLLLVSACDRDDGVTPLGPEVISWSEGQTVVCFGTSLTYGWGSGCRILPPRSCEADSSYPASLQRRLRLDVINMGIPAATTSAGLLNVAQVLGRSPALVLLEFGANDLFQDVPVGEARADLRDIIQAFSDHGIPVALLSFVHPDMLDLTPTGHRLEQRQNEAVAYHRMLVGLAAEFALPLVDNLLEGVWWQEDLMHDQVHPNGRGYLLMEQNVFAALESLFAASGMLR